MKLEGTYTFDAPQDVVWNALQDPVVLAAVMPGCEKLDKTGDDEYEGVLKIKMGTMQGKFKGKIKLSDINAPTGYTMHVKGNGALGFVEGTGSVLLSAENGQTLMTYDGDAKVGGRIATVGQRLMDSSAKAIVKQSLDGLNKQIVGAGQAQETGAPPPPPPEQPSQTEFAYNVARDMAQDAMKDSDNLPLMIAGALVGTLFTLYIFSEWFTNKIAKKVAKKLAKQNRKR